MKKLSPGIDARTYFIFKLDNDILSLSGNEIIKHLKCELDTWTPVEGLEIIGLNNSFVKVKEIYHRRLIREETLIEINVDGSRRVNLTYNYPCVTIDDDRQLTCIKNTFQLEPGINNIPMGKILQSRLPNARNDSLLGKFRFLLEAEKESDDIKTYLSAVPLKGLRVIDILSRDKLNVIRIKLDFAQHRPYIQTATGILVYS